MIAPKAGTYTITNFIQNGNITSTAGWQQSSSKYIVPNADGGYIIFPVLNGIIHNRPSLRNMQMIKNHIIYGRCEQKVPSNTGAADSRFEWWPSDTYTLIFAKVESVIKDNEWHIASGRSTAKATGSYYLRNFSVNTTGAAWYRKNFLMFDLTAIFGAGNEPDKEWLDTNLPFFENTYELTVERFDAYVKQNDTWSTNKVSKIYEKQNGIWIQVNPRIKDNNTWIGKKEE